MESKFLSPLFLVFLFFKLVLSENCIYAPECPDLVSYNQGYICNENQSIVIKNRLINGVKSKTACCKALTCSQPWCSQNQKLGSNNSPTCSSNCRSSWFRFYPKSFLVEKAFPAGSFAPGISTFIGRTFKNGEMQIGRFQIVPPVGLFYTLDGEMKFENNSIEILMTNNFLWKNSSHGRFERNALTIKDAKNFKFPFYIARFIVNDQTHVGVVVRILGLMYYTDENGVERVTDCYEVLICPDEESLIEYTTVNLESFENLNSILTPSMNQGTTSELFSTTTTSRKKYSRTTRSRLTRKTTTKTKRTTKESSSNNWLLLTNTTEPSTAAFHLESTFENSTQSLGQVVACKLGS